MKQSEVWKKQRVRAKQHILFDRGQFVSEGCEGWMKDLAHKTTTSRYVEWDNGIIGYNNVEDLEFMKHPENRLEVY